VFVPVAIETAWGTWHHQAVELVQEIGRRTARPTLQAMARCNASFHMFNVLVPTGFVLVGQKILIILILILQLLHSLRKRRQAAFHVFAIYIFYSE